MTSLRWYAIAVSALALGACTNEKIVFVNRQFNPPPDSVNGFLGYFDAATQQTTCGNCHVEHQGEWKATKHAQAWADLQALAQPADKSACVGCHSVSPNGNLAPDPSGYTLVQSAAYHDVQCESCHGPGFDHATVPDAGSAPLARITADTGALSAGTCAACHAGSHHPLVEEWKQSIHALNGRHADEADVSRVPHGPGRVEAWGVTAAYVGSEDPIAAANGLGITCAVCHDPHGAKDPATYTAQLRWPITTSDREQNLCMKCHARRTEPLAMDSTRALSPGGSNSPHAPQGAVVIGEVGYQNQSYIDPVLIAVAKSASHGNLAKNPKLCAGCHLLSFPRRMGDAGRPSYVDGPPVPPDPLLRAGRGDTDGLDQELRVHARHPVRGRSFKSCASFGLPCERRGTGWPAGGGAGPDPEPHGGVVGEFEYGDQRDRHAGHGYHSRDSQGHVERAGDTQQPVPARPTAPSWRATASSTSTRRP